ncbi:MAG: hypothetical protein GX316_11545 [Firmicutes bacterium]|nr:hypothetical protein [Bacillota bacterium]
MCRRLWIVVGTLLLVVLMSSSVFAYSEAPMLAKEVKQGLLPPVAERLPENPMVITPLREVGRYGGT